MQDAFQRSSSSAEVATALRKQRALVSHLYSFSPTHAVSHPSFQVFTILPQSHVDPHPGWALLWLCSGLSLQCPGAKPNTFSSPCSWGCSDRLCLFSLPFAYCLQEKCPLHHSTGGLGGAPQKQNGSYLHGVMPVPQKVGDGQLCKIAHQPTKPWLWLNRRYNAHVSQQQLGLHMDHPSGISDSSWERLASLPIPVINSNANKLLWWHTTTKKSCLISEPSTN